MSVEDPVNAADAGVCAAALPVLARQVDRARGQTEHAVRRLNGLFLGVMQQLHEMSSLVLAMHEGGTAAFERMDREFAELLQLQASLAHDHAELARKATALAPALSGLLALSRELANPRLTQQIEDVAQRAFSVMDEHGHLSEAMNQAASRTRGRSRTVLASHGEAMSSLSRCEDALRNGISDCLVELQFEDRASQILAHVSASMGLLAEYMHSSRGPATQELRQRFLSDMARGYTTDEQKDEHAALAAAHGATT